MVQVIILSMDKQEFKRIIEKRIESEKKAMGFLQDSMEKTSNPVIQLLFCQLALDSAKHEKMLKAVSQLLQPPAKEQFRCEGEEFRKTIEKHVEVERGMLEGFEEIVDKTEDRRIRFILQEIISDEKKHHAIMKRLYELVCEDDKVKDEKWWDFLFRYSRLTG